MSGENRAITELPKQDAQVLFVDALLLEIHHGLVIRTLPVGIAQFMDSASSVAVLEIFFDDIHQIKIHRECADDLFDDVGLQAVDQLD